MGKYPPIEWESFKLMRFGKLVNFHCLKVISYCQAYIKYDDDHSSFIPLMLHFSTEMSISILDEWTLTIQHKVFQGVH